MATDTSQAIIVYDSTSEPGQSTLYQLEGGPGIGFTLTEEILGPDDKNAWNHDSYEVLPCDIPEIKERIKKVPMPPRLGQRVLDYHNYWARDVLSKLQVFFYK
ncbi:MAG: hypothetical protein Q9190_000872 [Brigantiaea leucoxantha]